MGIIVGILLLFTILQCAWAEIDARSNKKKMEQDRAFETARREQITQEIMDIASRMSKDQRFQSLLIDLDCAIKEQALVHISLSPYTVDITEQNTQSSMEWAIQAEKKAIRFWFDKYGLSLRSSNYDVAAFSYVLLQRYPFLVYHTCIVDSENPDKRENVCSRQLIEAYFSADVDTAAGERTKTLWNSNRKLF